MESSKLKPQFLAKEDANLKTSLLNCRMDGMQGSTLIKSQYSSNPHTENQIDKTLLKKGRTLITKSKTKLKVCSMKSKQENLHKLTNGWTSKTTRNKRKLMTE
tara:strand:+ start:321 stop:629 length:309 start_codon:yes stop_codon:yes gene_type:complete